MFSNLNFIYGLIFVAALLGLSTLFQIVGNARKSKSQVTNRIEALREEKGAEVAYGELLQRRGLGGRDGEQTLGGRLNRLIIQTGRELSPIQRVLYLIALIFLGYVLCLFLITSNSIAAAVFGVVFGFTAAVVILVVLRNRRRKLYTEQLAPALDIIVRSLNAGHPLATSIALVSREMPDPIGSEFGILSDQLTFGSELEQAMLNMYDRVGSDELNMITVSVSVQRGTGGNLAEILENLAKMIRSRIMIKAKIKAISAEGRVTAWIMLIFPFALYYMLNILIPSYFDLVWESGYGGFIMGGCLALIFFGMIIIRRLVNFDF